MKKILVIVLTVICFGGFGFAVSQLDQAISWMNQNGLTKFNNATDFMATKSLRRDEASKFFVQYAKEIKGLTPDTSKTTCNFTDLSKARPDLKDIIKEACQLGLFQGYNGKFMPTQALTNAQAITVLIRMIDGKKTETQGHFAQLYFEKAQELGIMNGLTLNTTANFDKLTTRGDVGILIHNTFQLSTTGTQSTNQNTTQNCNSLNCLLGLDSCPNECKSNDTISCQDGYHTIQVRSSSYGKMVEECVSSFQLCKIGDKRQSSQSRITAENLNIDSGIWKKEYTNGSRDECKLYCNDGFTNINGNIINKTECFPIRTCSIENGVGSQIYQEIFYPKKEFIRSSCKATSCNEGFSILLNKCIPETKISVDECTVNNGVGLETVQGTNRLGCKVTSCNIGYHINGNSCIKIPNTKTCKMLNGLDGLMYYQNQIRTECMETEKEKISEIVTCETSDGGKGFKYFLNNTRAGCIIQKCSIIGTILENNQCVCYGNLSAGTDQSGITTTSCTN